MREEEKKNGNGMMGLLQSLLSGDKRSGLLILLVLLTGGGNFLKLTTNDNGTREEFTHAFSEIHDLHMQLSASVERQKNISETVQRIEAKLEKLNR